MRKIILGMAVLFSVLSFGQDTEFSFTKDGFTDYVITPVENKTQSELYKKAIDWIAVTFKNPKEVIKSQIENEFIRIEGSSSIIMCPMYLGGKHCIDSKYMIEISFKDNKYKFEFISIENYIESMHSWIKQDLNNIKLYFNEDGSPKKNFRNYPIEIPLYFNDLNKNLKEYLSGKSNQLKKDW